MSTAQWTCQRSYLATPPHPGSFLWVRCHSNDFWCNAVTRWAVGTEGFQQCEPPRQTSHFVKTAVQVLDRWWRETMKFFHYSLGPSWVCVQTEHGTIQNILKTESKITEKWETQCVCFFVGQASQIDYSVRDGEITLPFLAGSWQGWQLGCIISTDKHLFTKLPRNQWHASASLF